MGDDEFWAEYPLQPHEEPKKKEPQRPKTWRGRPVVQAEDVLRMLRETELTTNQIAQTFGRSDALICLKVKKATGMTPTEYRKAHGWVGGKRGRGASPARQQKILLAYRAGAPRRRLGRFGNSKIILAATIQDEKRVSLQKYLLPDEVIAQRYRDGESLLALGRAYRVNERTIRRILDEQGVERRGHRSRAGRAEWAARQARS